MIITKHKINEKVGSNLAVVTSVCKPNDRKHKTKILYQVLPKASNQTETIQKIQQAFGDEALTRIIPA